MIIFGIDACEFDVTIQTRQILISYDFLVVPIELFLLREG